MTFNYLRMFYQEISVYCFVAIIIPHGRFPFFSPFRDRESNWFLLSLKYLLKTITSTKNGICACTKHYLLSFWFEKYILNRNKSIYIFISTSITYTNEHKYYGEEYQNSIKHGYVKTNLAVKLAPWRKLVIRMHQFNQIIVIVWIK